MSVDVAKIREWLDFFSAGYSPPRLRQAREWLAALCDEMEALRAVHDWYRDQHAAVAARLAAKDAENKRLREALKSAFDTFGDILDRIADVPASEWPFDPEQDPAAARRLVDAADDVDILALDALDALRAALADEGVTR